MAKQKSTLNRADIFLLKKIFTSKKDLSKFATKKDLAQLATKKDLKQLATKKDLLKFETKKEAAKRHERTIKIIFKYLDENFATKEDFRELQQKISNLPTKEDFFKEMDKLAREYKSFREEKEIILRHYERIRQQLNIS